MSDNNPLPDSAKPKKQGDALLIVDVQNGFICPSTAHIPALVEKLQYNYKTVFVTQFYNQEDSFFRTLLNWNQVKIDTQEFQLAFIPKKNAILLEKTFYSCVTPEFLDELAMRLIKQVDICGIETDICVTKCAVDLFENGIEPVILKNHCGSTTGNNDHQQGLQTLAKFIGSGQIR